MKATTDLTEIRQNIQALAQRLVATSNVSVTLRLWQEHTTAERRAGYYVISKSYDDFITMRQEYIEARGLRDSVLNEWDVAYMNAESRASQERWHIMQSILHEIDKLSLVQMRREERDDPPVEVQQPATTEVQSDFIAAEPQVEEIELGLVDVSEPEVPETPEEQGAPGKPAETWEEEEADEDA